MSAPLKRAVNADIIITNGLGLTKERLKEIETIAKDRGVIGILPIRIIRAVRSVIS